MSDAVLIRPVHETDRGPWQRLWRGYLAFYKADVSDDVSELTFRRLCDPEAPICGFAAVAPGRAAETTGDHAMLGVVHYLFHPVTWSAGPRCYLEDLFVAPEARGQGVGRRLIEAVYAAADARGADQVYWLTANDNATARRLYDAVASATPFIKYRR